MINSPFNYTGNKFKLLEQILPHFKNTETFIDVFTGGGSIYTNVLDKYNNIIINDIITDLILLHEKLITNKNYIIQKLNNELYLEKEDKDKYNLIRENYNNNYYKDDNYIAFYALLLSCTNNMMRFNNKFKFNQTFGKRFFNSNTEIKLNEWINSIKKFKGNITYSNKHFSELNYNIKNSFYYFDPPYGYIKKNKDEIDNKQISEAGYNCYWKKEDDIKLYNIIIDNNINFAISGLLEHDGKTSWLLNKLKNDRFNVIELNYDYNKVARNKNDKNSVEVLITNEKL
jgi:DNA adenine methylase Dam